MFNICFVFSLDPTNKRAIRHLRSSRGSSDASHWKRVWRSLRSREKHVAWKVQLDRRLFSNYILFVECRCRPIQSSNGNSSNLDRVANIKNRERQTHQTHKNSWENYKMTFTLPYFVFLALQTLKRARQTNDKERDLD